MPLMTYDQWKTRTNAGLLKTRSAELKQVDDALRVFLGARTLDNLIALRAAIERWQRTKPDWAKSIRNTDSQGRHPVQELVDAVGTNAPAACVPSDITLREPGNAQNFTLAMKHNLYQAWEAWPDDAHRLDVIRTSLAPVFDLCRVPSPDIVVANIAPNNGLFVFTEWAVKVNSFNQPARPAQAWFIGLSACIYHESRHCEQWYLMGRYRADAAGLSGTQLAAEMQIPLNVAVQAAAAGALIGHRNELAAGWYQSVYAGMGGAMWGNDRGFALRRLGLRRVAGTERLQGISEMRQRVYSGYRSLSEEDDAWATQRLVEAPGLWA